MGLVTIADLDARRIGYQDITQAQAGIDDVSARVRACVAPELDDVEADDPETPAVDQDVPESVVAIVVGIVRRELTNPRALAQETLGDYSYASGTSGTSSGYPTAREKKLLRRAVGKSGAGTVETSAPLPRMASEEYRP